MSSRSRGSNICANKRQAIAIRLMSIFPARSHFAREEHISLVAKEFNVVRESVKNIWWAVVKQYAETGEMDARSISQVLGNVQIDNDEVRAIFARVASSSAKNNAFASARKLPAPATDNAIETEPPKNGISSATIATENVSFNYNENKDAMSFDCSDAEEAVKTIDCNFGSVDVTAKTTASANTKRSRMALTEAERAARNEAVVAAMLARTEKTIAARANNTTTTTTEDVSFNYIDNDNVMALDNSNADETTARAIHGNTSIGYVLAVPCDDSTGTEDMPLDKNSAGSTSTTTTVLACHHDVDTNSAWQSDDSKRHELQQTTFTDNDSKSVANETADTTTTTTSSSSKNTETSLVSDNEVSSLVSGNEVSNLDGEYSTYLALTYDQAAQRVVVDHERARWECNETATKLHQLQAQFASALQSMREGQDDETTSPESAIEADRLFGPIDVKSPSLPLAPIWNTTGARSWKALGSFMDQVARQTKALQDKRARLEQDWHQLQTTWVHFKSDHEQWQEECHQTERPSRGDVHRRKRFKV